MDKLKVLGDLLGIGFHVADYYTDLATTKLYWDNCQLKFFLISIGIFIYAYVGNVLFLLYIYKEKNIYRAFLHPYIVLKILFKKIMIGLKSKYMLYIYVSYRLIIFDHNMFHTIFWLASSLIALRIVF